MSSQQFRFVDVECDEDISDFFIVAGNEQIPLRNSESPPHFRFRFPEPLTPDEFLPRLQALANQSQMTFTCSVGVPHDQTVFRNRLSEYHAYIFFPDHTPDS